MPLPTDNKPGFHHHVVPLALSLRTETTTRGEMVGEEKLENHGQVVNQIPMMPDPIGPGPKDADPPDFEIRRSMKNL
jgi:hypothetical protein